MRRSKKETILLEPGSRLMHNDIHEANGMQGDSFATEAAQEWATSAAAVKQAPRKPLRS